MRSPPTPDVDVTLVDKAISLWKSGQVVVFPTETVYGLGADATNAHAVARIYEVKSRPRFNPLIVHVASIDRAKTYGVWNHAAEVLAHHFWPGPLTLVCARTADCPISDLVSAGGDTVAIRIPRHPTALALLHAWEGGIAAPSANRSGRVSPTSAEHARAELGDAVPLIIDGGLCDIGLESTVIDVSGDHPVILRPGGITRPMLHPLVEKNRFELRFAHDDAGHGTLKSPGQLASHYAPCIPVRLNARDVASTEALLAFGTPVPAGAKRVMQLSERGDLVEAAANLFSALHTLDSKDYACIAVMPIPETGIGEAINDRLRRAAA